MAWVREEFEALWQHPEAVDLAEAVVTDIARVARRVVVPDVPGWKRATGGMCAGCGWSGRRSRCG